MKSNLRFSKDRSISVNIVFCILCFLGLLVFSDLLQILIDLIIKNSIVSNFISNFIFILCIYFMYFKDLNKEFKLYFKNFKNNISTSFKYYIMGFLGMVFFNIFIALFVGGISSNEEQVREMLFNNFIITMISISIIAPILEELIFRKSLEPIIKNKWVYVIVSGLLFGFAHLLTNIVSGSFTITDLVFILPYASLGASFALMDNETKTVFSSIVIHAIHNTCTALLLFALYKGGLL